MNAVEIIARKRDGQKLSKDEISFFIDSLLKDDIKDYQMSALLMAIYLNGMDFEETAQLTDAMLRSGERVVFPEPNRIYIDKHSTGGIGDKVSLILAPLVACCGVKVPMLSGRGLGHTGGTLDKLESIPGYKTDLAIEEFKKGVEDIGCVISGQTPQMAPADRIMYALRDVTATVESIPLICSSILSKKFAAGPSGLVFDIKCGNGAFMKDMKSAESLAENLIAVCRAMDRSARALITDMNQPLGYTAGNLLEVAEAIDAMRGNCSPDLYRVTLEIAVEMLMEAGIEENRAEAKNLLEKKLGDGSAYEKFSQMVAFQKGDLSLFEEPSRRPAAGSIVEYKALMDGYLQEFRTDSIGRLIVDMGGGRKTKDDIVDPLVGLKFYKKIGDKISSGEPIVVIHARERSQVDMVSRRLEELIKIGPEKSDPPDLIKKRII
jgi:pyrimidine-nucleoside phosphorylase